jgi:hypothetical protein
LKGVDSAGVGENVKVSVGVGLALKVAVTV